MTDLKLLRTKTEDLLMSASVLSERHQRIRDELARRDALDIEIQERVFNPDLMSLVALVKEGLQFDLSGHDSAEDRFALFYEQVIELVAGREFVNKVIGEE